MVKTQALPIGIQSFEDIRNNNYLYVDKTEEIYNLISSGKVYFLSRPRRFGKSLLISTLHAFFSGKKELFSGLKIEKFEKDWESYPVFYFDFGGKEYKTRKDLEEKLFNILDNIKAKYELSTTQTVPEFIFSELIKSAAEKYGKNVVVLVDEYDKVLLETVENKTENEDCRSLLRGFFGVLKPCIYPKIRSIRSCNCYIFDRSVYFYIVYIFTKRFLEANKSQKAYFSVFFCNRGNGSDNFF